MSLDLLSGDMCHSLPGVGGSQTQRSALTRPRTAQKSKDKADTEPLSLAPHRVPSAFWVIAQLLILGCSLL